MFNAQSVGVVFSCLVGRPLRHAIVFTALSLAIVTSASAAEQLTSAVALLRGAELARTTHDSLKVRLEIEYVSPTRIVLDCLVEMDASRRRIEYKVLAGDAADQIIIRDGDEFRAYRRKENEDVEVYGLKRALGVRGDVAFDPRILGLSDIMSCDTTVKDCLWYEASDGVELTGQESLHGTNVWKVRVVRSGSTAQFWIEQPSFRVHKKVVETRTMHIVVESVFDSDNRPFPFPRRVVATRKYKDPRLRSRDERRIYLVKSFELGAEIPPERFTLKSMDLPINTAVVDYRIHRILGYWDGESLSEQPVYQGERPSTGRPPAPQSRNRFLMIGVNLFVLLALIVVVWWWKRGG